MRNKLDKSHFFRKRSCLRTTSVIVQNDVLNSSISNYFFHNSFILDLV